ncbi:MAG: alpha-2-macroglobulin family protein [Treponema sp.]|nr:alpha-2-macroglobulin family protein [Treponema sp.]
MKLFNKIIGFSILSILLLSLISCNSNKGSKKKNGKVPVDYRVFEPSSRLNSEGKPDSLLVNFDGSVASLEDVGKAPNTDIVISPAISGQWLWVDDTKLRFTPSSPWELNTRYKFTMPATIFSEQVSIKSDFSFKTDSFSVYLDDSEFYINPLNPEEKRVTCTLKASHQFVKESIKDSIQLVFEYYDYRGKVTRSQDCNFKLNYSDDLMEAYIVSENLPIPPYTSNVKIILKKGVAALVGGKSSDEDSASVSIPGMSDFVSIRNVFTNLVKNEEQNYDHTLIIESKGSVAVEELGKHISVYELPKDRPEMEGYPAEKDFYWSSGYVTDFILNQSKKISLEEIPTPEPASTLNSFKYQATPDRFLYVRIEGGIDFFGGYKLRFDNDENASEYILRVPRYPKELGIMSEGTILSLSGSKKMAMYSRGLSKVYYRLSRIMPKDVNHLVSMSNGNMKNFRFENYSFNENNIAESEISSYQVLDASEKTISYFSYDFTEKLKSNPNKNLKNGLFIFQVAEDDDYLGSNSYYSGLSDRRLILITDLGFVVKKNTDGTRDVFVQNISTGLPASYATVRVVGLNGNTLISTQTDTNGHARLPQVSGYYDEHRPTAFIVETANDLAFMPYSERGRVLDYSNYDIGGEYGKSDPKRITAYLFNDRGMYRPGETAHLAFIAKAGDWNIDLQGTPLEIEITDPNGSIVFNRRIQLSSSGFEEIDFETQDYSPTGFYTANLYLIKEYSDWTDREFLTSNQIKVEEFLPDTLSLTTGFDPLPGNGWINPGQLKGSLALKNLFGTPASGNDVKAQLTLTPGFPVLYKYSDYYFTDPYYKGKSFEEFLGTKQTDDKGEASFDIDLAKFEKATYRLNFYVEAFEKASGRSVTSQSSLYVSPLKYLIGYKADGSLGYINSKSVRKLSFIAINQELEQIDLDDVSLEIEEIRYISTLVKQSNGLYKYQSVKKSYPVSSQKISISKKGSDYILPSELPGEYKLVLKNSEGLVFNTINYTIVGDKNVARSLTRTAELELKLQTADLNPGSTAEIFIKAPYEGTGLITIERDHVYSYKWFKTNGLSSVQTIQIPNDLEGNGYINVMFTRSIDSKEIFMSPFCYGAVPFSVGRERRNNKIDIKVPSEVKSGNDLEIKYSSSDSGRIILFAIDEGILQVAKYKTPNPLSHFFKKRALEVTTSQILDLVLPEFNILKTLGATGGGASMDMLAKNLNPFKRKQNASVAYWSGIMETGPETRSVTYHVPDYFNGSLRIMAVAVSKDKIGVEETSILARNPLIITPNVPLAAAPGDEFDVSVTVTNNHKGSGNNKVTLNALPSKHLEIIGEPSASFTIAEGKDATCNFRVKTKEILGSADLLFVASDSSETCKLNSTLSVRPSMPYQVWVTAGVSKKPSIETDVDHRLYDELAQREVSVSNVPTSFIDSLNFYLAKYPYGCAEQVTSKAYPYLYEDFVKSGNKTQADAKKMVSDTIGILQSRMKYDGNIGYWTSKSPTDSFITLYCAEFLTDARNKDFYVPSEFYNKVMKAVKVIANSSNDDEYGIYLRAYAIYVLTKDGIVTTSYLENLESDLSYRNYSPTDYSGLYLAASYAMLKQDKEANRILQKIKNSRIFDSSWAYHNGLHYISTYIDVIASYFPERVSDIKSTEVDLLCNSLQYCNYNTYSTSAAIRAFESYAYLEKGDVYKVYAITGDQESEIPLTGDIVLKGQYKDNVQKIKYTTDKTMPLYYGTLQAGFEKEIPTAPIKDGLEISREYLSADGGKLSEIKVGDTITVKISFRSLAGSLSNIALVDLSPAGLETDIQSIRNEDTGDWEADYVDIREDRVVIYGTVSQNVNTFTYKAKAVSSGKFVVPPMFAESMYNKEIRAFAPQDPITINPAK